MTHGGGFGDEHEVCPSGAEDLLYGATKSASEVYDTAVGFCHRTMDGAVVVMAR